MNLESAIEPQNGLDLKELFVVHEAPLLRFAYKLTMNVDIAQDIVQEAFIRLSSRIADVSKPRAWLFTTVHNLAMKQLRAQGKSVSLQSVSGGEDSQVETSPEPSESLEKRERAGQIRVCLERLPERERLMIQLKYDQGCSYKEIARRMGMTISNVGYVLHHALKKLELELREEGVSA